MSVDTARHAPTPRGDIGVQQPHGLHELSGHGEVVSVPVNDLPFSQHPPMYAISRPPLVHRGEIPPLVDTRVLRR